MIETGVRETAPRPAGIKSYVLCPLCKSSRHQYWATKDSYRLMTCRECQASFTADRIEVENVQDMYNNYYSKASFDLPPTVAQSLGRLLSSFEPYRQTNRLLDIGYGEGGLLTVAVRHGWKCFGTEVSPHALEFGERQGWVVTPDADLDPRFTAEPFDVITVTELVEHVYDPDPVLRTAARLLRPGGLLYITTPNGEGLNRRILGVSWSVFSPPEHLVVWTARGAGHALRRAGLRPVWTRTDGFNPYEIAALVRPARERAAVDRNTTGACLNEALSKSPLRMRIKAAINGGLSLFRLGDRLKIAATRPPRGHP